MRGGAGQTPLGKLRHFLDNSKTVVCRGMRLGNGENMRGQEFLARLRDEVLIGDGALGTMISERGIGRETNYERLNLTNPEFIQDLHSAYLAAGSQFIETNTFGANRTKLALFNFAEDVSAINRAGVSLARAAAGSRAYIGGSI